MHTPSTRIVEHGEVPPPHHAYSDFARIGEELPHSANPRPLNGPHGEGHTKLGANHQALFLKQLQLFGNVRLACRAARVSAQTAYRVRRRSAAFADAWDTAIVAARAHGEAVLADRAVNGWEEPVFYHGEEIARRKRFSDRLLLAHLARLDKMEEREELSAMLPLLDDVIEKLERGEEIEAALAQVQEEAGPVLREAGQAENDPQDRVPSVPSCRETGSDEGRSVEPCEECGGACADPEAELTQKDCQWLGNRLNRLDAARPKHAPTIYELANDDYDADDVEIYQLAAFEEGVDEWWLLPCATDALETASSDSPQESKVDDLDTGERPC